jgi:hypothetical protein
VNDGSPIVVESSNELGRRTDWPQFREYIISTIKNAVNLRHDVLPPRPEQPQVPPPTSPSAMPGSRQRSPSQEQARIVGHNIILSVLSPGRQQSDAPITLQSQHPQTPSTPLPIPPRPRSPPHTPSREHSHVHRDRLIYSVIHSDPQTQQPSQQPLPSPVVAPTPPAARPVSVASSVTLSESSSPPSIPALPPNQLPRLSSYNDNSLSPGDVKAICLILLDNAMPESQRTEVLRERFTLPDALISILNSVMNEIHNNN